MFTGKRYITVGIHQTIPTGLQEFLWELIDDMTATNDYLQVFELTISKRQQELEHRQEQPPYSKRYILKHFTSKPITAKIFVIDSGDYSTMMLASEY